MAHPSQSAAGVWDSKRIGVLADALKVPQNPGDALLVDTIDAGFPPTGFGYTVISAAVSRRPLWTPAGSTTPSGGPTVPSPVYPPAFVALVRRVAAGDRAALRILYNALCEPVSDQIRRGLPLPQDVRAVVDATFVEVWWMARFHVAAVADSDVLTWVLGVARQRATERLRAVGVDARDEGIELTLHRLLRPAAPAMPVRTEYAAPVPGLRRRH
jgi:hypothetical protein